MKRFLIAIALLAACHSAQAEDRLRVGKPSPQAYDFALLQVGIEAGIFKELGLAIETITFEGSAKQHQAMTAKSIDISLGAGTDFLFIAKGAPERGVAAMAGPPNNMALIVAAKGPIHGVDDLRGKKIGVSTVGSLTYWLAQQFSRRQGWGNDGVVIVPVGGMQGEAAGIVSGNLDAGVGSLEGGMALARKGQGKILVMFGDLVHPFLAHAIFATDDLMKDHPDQLRRFLKGWFATVAYSKSHKAEAIRISQAVTQLPDDEAAEIYENESPMFSTDGRFDPAAVEVVRQSLVDMGQIEKLPANDVLFTEKFLN